MTDDLTTTQQIYKPIADNNASLLQAMANLNSAIARGDEPEMKKLFDQVQFLKAQMPSAAAAARSRADKKNGLGR